MKLLPLVSAAATTTIFSLAPAAPSDPTQSPRSGNLAICKRTQQDTITWKFSVETFGPWGRDFGSGLLNNLHDRCGQIDGWGFDYAGDKGDNGDSGDKGVATFTTSTLIAAYCVEDAIWLASNPTGAMRGVRCDWVL
ncbi:hypothetical protein BZA05DRAFT_415187 [Tricharina praecox]|uniref:uncharacterized protein n=1 Tax=Tricharina praecox TaxID=43433 RepID=UPI002220C27F|nr:uncharacterized protein BZA05DRAFT_415187 [Tricharina praecox]KAI5857797.1 hypothetical protein BZA05DRAFT_415187 [Tricharina praecox]